MVELMSQAKIEDNKVFEVQEDIVSRKNQDGTVVLMKMDDSEMFYKIDGVAASVWKAIEEKKEVGAIKTEIVGEFNVSPDQVNTDVESFINDLIGKSIVK